MSTGIKTIFGAAGLGRDSSWFAQALDTLEAHHVDTLDTAELYTDSEKVLGEHEAHKRFVIDTKFASVFGGSSAKPDTILKSASKSLSTLGTKQVDIYYIHAPDKDTPLEETLKGIQQLYEQGAFKRFGLSNYKAADVQKAYDVCKQNGYVLPTVYQGNYSPVARRQETELLPTLRKLNMAFYAYSPLAGGFLTKTAKDLEEGKGRFNKDTPLGKMYSSLYAERKSLVEALSDWEAIAKEVGCGKAELAYRWVKYDSPLKPENGDGIIVGARTLEQLQETLKGLEAGPLPKDVVKKIDEVWEKIKHEAPLDNLAG